MQVWNKGACLLFAQYVALHILTLVILTQHDLYKIHRVINKSQLTLSGGGCFWGSSTTDSSNCKIKVISVAEQPVSSTLKASMACL